MTETTDLLGVIGTWVAAFLAIVALAGVLPVYLLYRRSQTDRFLALSRVDDPRHQYIARLKLLFIRPYHVPDLQKAPKLDQISVERKKEPFLSGIGARSMTGWVNFANVLGATWSTIPKHGELEFSGQEALLPVHRGWLLLLGLVDGYSDARHRSDKGLLLEDAHENETDEFREGAMFGLSGVMQRVGVASGSTRGDVEAGGPLVDKVVFYMHAPQHMARLPDQFQEGDVPLLTRIASFLGYVCRGNEFYDLKQVRNGADTYVYDYGRNCTCWKWVNRTIDTIPVMERRMMLEIGMELPEKLFRLEACQINRDVSWKDDDPSQEYCPLNGDNTWISRSDLHVPVLLVLQQPVSRQPVLYASRNNILDELFNASNLAKSLKNAQRVVQHLGLSEEKKSTLDDAITKAIEKASSNLGMKLKRWSRTTMNCYVTLDRHLAQNCQTDQPLSRVISILYMQERRFRKHCISRRITNRNFDFAFSDNVVLVPSNEPTDPPLKFYFNFNKVFRAAEIGASSLSFPYAMMACLQGHLRMAMWKMMLPDYPLRSFYASLKSSTVYIAPLETPLHFGSERLQHMTPRAYLDSDRRIIRRRYNDSSDSSETDTDISQRRRRRTSSTEEDDSDTDLSSNRRISPSAHQANTQHSDDEDSDTERRREPGGFASGDLERALESSQYYVDQLSNELSGLEGPDRDAFERALANQLLRGESARKKKSKRKSKRPKRRGKARLGTI